MKACRVFTDTAYESGGASILKADQVAKDARARVLPLLATDETQIASGSFSLPE